MKKIWLFLFASLPLLVNAQHLHLDTAGLNRLLDSLNVAHLDMCSVTLTVNGKTVYHKVTGYQKIKASDSLKSTGHTKYRIGSISKLFTAAMVFQLAEEHRIHLNETIERWFPKVPDANKITIADLLSHRGGLSDIKNIPGFEYWMRSPHTEAEVLKVIEASNVDFQPGTSAAYSNSGFIILSYLLERVTGKSYPVLLKERITGKLGMTDTYESPVRGTRPEEAFCYRYEKGWQALPETDWSIPSGAGAIVSTTRDLAIFMNALFSGKLISATSLKKMSTIHDGYGMDLVIMNCPKQPALGHTGGMDGFLSTLTYVPADKLVLAYTSNAQVTPMEDVIGKIFALVYH